MVADLQLKRWTAFKIARLRYGLCLRQQLVLSIPMPAFRAVQGEVTAEPASDVYAPGEACRPDEGRIDIGAGCPVLSMVRESYGCIIGDAPTGGAPVW